jgi:hypothetical protein
MMEDYMVNPMLPAYNTYDVGVDFDEFANPSFENQIGILSNALMTGALSIDRYVDLLWGDSLDEQGKQAEKAYIEAFMGRSQVENIFNYPNQADTSENEIPNTDPLATE